MKWDQVRRRSACALDASHVIERGALALFGRGILGRLFVICRECAWHYYGERPPVVDAPDGKLRQLGEDQ